MKTEQNKKVAIFGGTFNPFHTGHLHVLNQIQDRFNFDQVNVVPAAQNPLKESLDGPTPEERLEMLKLGVQDLNFVNVDEQELKRGGKSFTVDTVSFYSQTHKPENLFLVVGADQFENFDQWKNFEEILKLCNLIVVARPGFHFPFSVDELPEGLKNLVSEMEKQFITLKTDRSIEFLRIKESKVSATDVRKKLRSDRQVDQLLPIKVEEYIRSKGLYAPLKEKIADFKKFSIFCADALFAKKAIAVKAYDLEGLEAPTDFTLIASGTSTRHASSLAEAVVMAVKEEYNVRPQAIEGLSEGRWIVIDYGALIVHVFYDFVRQEYMIEDLWRRAKPIELVDKALAGKA